jgi:glycosyltransferase involved in cell wall biosynthesis
VAEGYREATFLVVPSRWFEGCPLVILEAMAAGIPVIASNIGGLPELVEHGVTGLLFEPGNAEELAEAMRLLWTDRARCRELGAAGRAVAAEKYDARLQWQRLRSVYDMAVNMDVETGPRSHGSAPSR